METNDETNNEDRTGIGHDAGQNKKACQDAGQDTKQDRIQEGQNGPHKIQRTVEEVR